MHQFYAQREQKNEEAVIQHLRASPMVFIKSCPYREGKVWANEDGHNCIVNATSPFFSNGELRNILGDSECAQRQAQQSGL
jgi:hypothetical protein